MDHHESAKELAASADTTTETDGWLVGIQLASRATAHAVLALINIIAGDRETETQQLYAEIVALKHENQALKQRLRELADQLDGCNNTLRKHEQAATANAKPNNEPRKITSDGY